jgi:hypothetical protein
MMTKPLTIFLELFGLIFFLVGFADPVGNVAFLVLGIGMFITGAIGTRNRKKEVRQ